MKVIESEKLKKHIDGYIKMYKELRDGCLPQESKIIYTNRLLPCLLLKEDIKKLEVTIGERLREKKYPDNASERLERDAQIASENQVKEKPKEKQGFDF